MRIQTDRGEVELRLQKHQLRAELKAGERVELEIPPGRPPRTANIKPANTEPAKAQTTETPPQRPLPQGQISAATPPKQAPTPAKPVPARPAETPVTVDVGAQETAPKPTIPRAIPVVSDAPLQAGQVVRLLALLPEQLAQITLPKITQEQRNILQVFDIKPTTPLVNSTIPPEAGPLIFQANIKPESIDFKPFQQAAASQNNLLSFAPNASAETVDVTVTPPPPVLQRISQPAVQTKALAGEPLAPSLPPVTADVPASAHLLQIPVMPQAFPQPPTLPVRAAAGVGQLDVQISEAPKYSIRLFEPQSQPLQQESALPQKIATESEKPVILQHIPVTELGATVSGTTPENLPVVAVNLPQTPYPQLFVMQFSTDTLPPGTDIRITPQPGTLVPAAPQAQAALLPVPMPLQPGPWPVLEDAYQALIQQAPHAAQAMARILPSPANPAQLGPAALFFLAAVRSGDIGGWLGERAIDALKRDGRNILTRLTGETGRISRAAGDQGGQDWRALTLPMFWQGEIQKISLRYKQQEHGDEDDPDDNEKQTRFIFDLSLNRMGGIQLDGLLRQKKLDLIVRTRAPLSQSMQQSMRRAWVDALESTELHGELSFQNQPEQWVTIQAAEKTVGVSA